MHSAYPPFHKAHVTLFQLTYADCVLWNFYLNDPSQPLTVDNIRIRDLFTKDSQEEHFFLTSARIEVRGFEAIQLMGDAIAMVRGATVSGQPVDEDSFKNALSRLSLVIDDLNKILWAVRDACGYQFFYWVFRPVSDGPRASTSAYTKQLLSGFGAPIKVMVRRNGITRELMAKEPNSNVLAPQLARLLSCMHLMVRQLPLYPVYKCSYITSFSLFRHWTPSEGRPIFPIMHWYACASIV